MNTSVDESRKNAEELAALLEAAALSGVVEETKVIKEEAVQKPVEEEQVKGEEDKGEQVEGEQDEASVEEPEEGELRRYGDLYVEDSNEKLYRRIVFTNKDDTEELEVLLYRLGYIEMISVGGCSVPLSDFLAIEYLGYWDNDWITVHLKSRHTVKIPQVSNDMLIQCLSYISKYPYEIPDGEEDHTDSDGDSCLYGLGLLLFVFAVGLWLYYLAVGTARISAAKLEL